MSEPVEVKTQPLAIGALGIQRRVVLRPNKDDIAFSCAIDSTAMKEDIYDLMDTIGAVADRERLKVQIEEKEEAYRVALEQPRQIEREIRRMQAQRAAYVATREAMHGRSGKRMPFTLTEKQNADLEKIDKEIEAATLSKASFARDLPLIRWEIARLRARVAGEEEPERPIIFDEAVNEMAGAA